MNKPGWAEETLSLTPLQRRLMLGLFGIVLIAVAAMLVRDRRAIADPQPPRGDHWSDLADRLDPNTADWTELSALPAMGEKRAKAIVARRDAVHARDPNAVAFAKPEDLYVVSGFGVSMVEQLKPYFRFADAPKPTTSPSHLEGVTP